MERQGSRPDILTQENCWKVTRSVEDAEIKTNVLKQNSALLEVRDREEGTPGFVGGGWRHERLEVHCRWGFLLCHCPTAPNFEVLGTGV
jgi:hypothetical protein